jgi:carbon-monoxide dehydrogenase small subunit
VTDPHPIEMVVNGRTRQAAVEARKTLADVLREDFRLTGTHLGCEHGVCGACTVLVDGRAVRSCLMFGVQANGAEVTTIEGLAPAPGELSDVQAAFRDCHGLQCGFCTPGFIISVEAFLADNPAPTDEEIRSALTGNLCRCTGYQGIVNAVRQTVRQRAEGRPTESVTTVDGRPVTTVPSAP